LFGQPKLRARWKNQYGGRPEDIRGLAVDEHVTRLREALMPLIERFNTMDGRRRDRPAQAAAGGAERAGRAGATIGDKGDDRRRFGDLRFGGSNSSCWRVAMDSPSQPNSCAMTLAMTGTGEEIEIERRDSALNRWGGCLA
jgi:hypothetical protein